jgi:hypothetical protein
VLDLADAEFPFAAGGALRAARLGIAHGRAVARRDARAAERLGAELAALAPPDDATDLPLRCAAALVRRRRVGLLLVLCWNPRALERRHQAAMRCALALMQ